MLCNVVQTHNNRLRIKSWILHYSGSTRAQSCAVLIKTRRYPVATADTITVMTDLLKGYSLIYCLQEGLLKRI